MAKPRGKEAKRRAVRKQQLRGEADAKRAKGSTSDPSLSRVLRVCLDLYIVFAANDVSGKQLMGDCPADAASPPPGELCRVLPP